MRVYSHSSLSSFEQCPRRFFYGYVEKPDIEPVETVEAFLGTRVHETLEQLYKLALAGRLMDLGATLALYEAEWERNWRDDVLIVRPDLSAADYRQVGRDGLEKYYRRHHPFDATQTLRLEARVLLDLDDSGRYRLRGYVDRIARRPDGAYEIHDYKTSGHLPTQAEADTDRQLALYQIGLAGMWPDVRDVDLVWHYLRFDTDIVSRRAPKQLDAVRSACIATIDDIESRGPDESEFPTKPSPLCKWCEFESVCPARRHHVAVALLPPEEAREEDGVRLVDEWAELRAKRKALAGDVRALEELEKQAEDRVAAYALTNGLESVAGTGYSARVRRDATIEVPATRTDERTAFEEALRECGVWDTVAAFNWQRLRSLWKDAEGLSDAQRAALAPFVTEIETVACSLKKVSSREE